MFDIITLTSILKKRRLNMGLHNSEYVDHFSVEEGGLYSSSGVSGISNGSFRVCKPRLVNKLEYKVSP